MVDLAREWLREASRPTFMMVHTQGAHSPYNSPNSWNRHQDETEPLREDYLNLVEFIDAQLGRFVDTLPSNATIIVTSDHGEALGESGEWGHKNEELDFLRDVPAVIAGSTPELANNIDHIDIHDWLREDIIPTHGDRVRSNDLEEQLEALGYVDGKHSV
jgi:arylsulfatase A-like enzyme